MDISASRLPPFSLLPRELVREIVEHLDPRVDGDRSALCALSLTCRYLCEESQRVLFRRGPTSVGSASAIVDTHHKFLNAIKEDAVKIGSGPRLADYVRCYRQNSALASYARKEDHDNNSVRELWSLTRETLPLLVRLSRLELHLEGCRTPAMRFFNHFQAQLTSFTWKGAGCTALATDFLPTQLSLQHLELCDTEIDFDTACIPENVRSRLSSIQCDSVTMWQNIATLHDVTKLCLSHCMERLTQSDLESLNRLTHLRLRNSTTLDELAKTRPRLEISLLELVDSDLEAALTLSMITFTQLQVLVLRNFEVDNGCLADSMRILAMGFFLEYPTLAFVIFPSDISGRSTYRFSRTSRREDENVIISLHFKDGDIESHAERHSEWWSDYEEMLNLRCCDFIQCLTV